MDVDEHATDYRGRIWIPIAEDVAAGYLPDLLGGWALDGIVMYGPDTEKVRGLKLRGLERLDSADPSLGKAMRQDAPTREQVAEAWSRGAATFSTREGGAVASGGRSTFAVSGDLTVTTAQQSAAIAKEVAASTAPEELSRREGESPDDFYRRIARAYTALGAAELAGLSRRPLMAELAHRAGVPVGTAAAWVSRARSRDLIGKDSER